MADPVRPEEESSTFPTWGATDIRISRRTWEVWRQLETASEPETEEITQEESVSV
jgi:hypothetical protein